MIVLAAAGLLAAMIGYLLLEKRPGYGARTMVSPS
jgi:hypothetical protein